MIYEAYNTDLDIADGSKVIWNYQTANRTPMTATDTFDISSSSGNDVAAGTGARQLTIIARDANGDVQTEKVTQAATWRTSNNYKELIDAYVSDAGTGQVNAGDIQIFGTGSGIRFGWIGAGDGRMKQAFYPIQNGFKAIIHRIYFKVNGTTETVTFKLFKFDGTVKTELSRVIIDAVKNDNDMVVLPDEVITSGYSWWIEASTNKDNTSVFVRVDQEIVKK